MINPLVAAFSASEIFIYGGYRSKQSYCESYIYDIASSTAQQITSDGHRCATYNNQCQLVKPGKVVGLGKDSAGILHVVSYERGDTKITVVASLGHENKVDKKTHKIA